MQVKAYTKKLFFISFFVVLAMFLIPFALGTFAQAEDHLSCGGTECGADADVCSPFDECVDINCNSDEECVDNGIATKMGWRGARCAGGNPNAAEQDKKFGRCIEVPLASQQLPEGPQRAGKVLDLLDLITDWVFAIAMTIALIFLIMAAFQFVTGGGDPQKVSEARQKLLYAFIGIGVAFVSAGFVRVIGELVK